MACWLAASVPLITQCPLTRGPRMFVRPSVRPGGGAGHDLKPLITCVEDGGGDGAYGGGGGAGGGAVTCVDECEPQPFWGPPTITSMQFSSQSATPAPCME